MQIPPVTILILAAGAARRMRGTDKLLEPVAGIPLLRRIAQASLLTGCPVLATLPLDRPARRDVLSDLPVTLVPVPEAELGMSESLRSGLAQICADRAVLVVLADLPEITGEDLLQVLAAQTRHPDAILRATAADGTPGHPVLFPPWLRPELLALTGDEGARTVLRHHAAQIRSIALPGTHAITDLDTPEAWAAWRSRCE